MVGARVCQERTYRVLVIHTRAIHCRASESMLQFTVHCAYHLDRGMSCRVLCRGQPAHSIEDTAQKTKNRCSTFVGEEIRGNRFTFNIALHRASPLCADSFQCRYHIFQRLFQTSEFDP